MSEITKAFHMTDLRLFWVKCKNKLKGPTYLLLWPDTGDGAI